MACDETLYRQYIDGDDEGLDALMKKYGDPLTLYIDGYLPASGTAASRRIYTRRHGIWRCAARADGNACSVWTS